MGALAESFMTFEDMTVGERENKIPKPRCGKMLLCRCRVAGSEALYKYA